MPRAASSSSLSYGAQVFEQQDHLVFLVCGAHPGAVCPRLLKVRDPFGELGAIARAVHGRIENTRAQELGNELKLVRRQTGQEAPGLGFQRPIGTLNKGGYQRLSHGRSPVGGETYEPSATGRIIANPATACKGWAEV
jgi:hypothetical protein